MSPKHHTPLQSARSGVDLSVVDHPLSRASPAGDGAAAERDRSELSVRQLAHELNSLLDGSMRCLGLARRCLTTPDESETSVDQALNKLQAAQQSLHHMAELLNEAMSTPTADHRLLDRRQPLGLQVQEMLEMLRPRAQELDVDLQVDVSPAAADLPSGPLIAVLLNGLKNAIEACTEIDRRAASVECSISVTAKRELFIVIADTGPGVDRSIQSGVESGKTTKPGGHGIGAALSQQIVVELGGSYRLSNVPFGRGAVLQVRIPLSGLQAA